ncbi:MAG: ABC transporter permease [Bacteroidota bacterium]
MTRFISWYCHPKYAEDLLGDLEEYYRRNLEVGRNRADFIYFLDAVKFMRPYLVRKVKLNNRMTNLNLVANYLKTAVRSIRRNQLFSGINLVGLGISMTVCLLMIAYVAELLSYDDFHSKRDRIYRVTNYYHNLTGDSFNGLFASTSLLVGKKLQEEVTGLEEVVIIRRNFSDDIRKGDNAVNITGYYTENQFWDIFSFELIQGNPETSLSHPESLVLSQSAAKKLFGDKNPIGEIVEGRDNNYTVTGVMRDVPYNSHMQFEALVPFHKLESEKQVEGDANFISWRSMWTNYVYFLLPEGGQIESIESSLAQLASVENAKTDRFAIDLGIENINEIVPGASRSNEIGPNFEWIIVYLLSGLTFIVMLSACFNYTNLSIARSLRRSKEVGVRKVVGANRGQITFQFLTEAVVIASCSLMVAWLLYFFVKGHFMAVFPMGAMHLDASWSTLVASVVFAIVMGLLAGIVPSLLLSRIPPIAILRDVSSRKIFRGVSLRRVLIVFQLCLSVAFVIATATTYRQHDYAINFDLGFRTEDIVNVSLQGNDPEVLKSALEQVPEISNISTSSMVMSTGSAWSETFTYKDPLDSASLWVNHVDRAFTTLHDFNFLAGGTFLRDLGEGDSSKYIIIDALTLNRFNMGTPEEAIGQKLTLSERGVKRRYEITGVIDEFQYSRIDWDTEPAVFLQGEVDQFRFLNLSVETQDPLGLMVKIEKMYRSIDDLHPLQAEFYDERINNAYQDFSKSFQIFSFLSVLAISIAMMGFLGIAVFTMETRMKEISVRKILGATEKQLVLLLSKGFLKMIVIAVSIATPLTYLLFSQVILEGISHRAPLGADILSSGGLVILFSALPIVIWQTLRTARTNPAETLRND